MKQILLGSVIFFSIVMFPSLSHAQAPFGGLVIFELPCTCSPFTWQWLTPLYFGPLPFAGALAAPDTPFLFEYYYSFPSTWVLGKYIPGVQACWMFAVAGCFPLPTIGLMTPFTGTSL